ncbi:MAG: nitroreductase family protein [Bacteroidales bacterium]
MSYFNELLQIRRSTRKFTEELLNPEEVELILKAGLMSPSSKKRNPWEFIVVEEKELLAKLSNCKGHGSSLIEGAAMAVVVIGDAIVSDVWIEDASIASILMQLQAEDLGIGSCWIQLRLRETEHGINSEEYVKDILNIPYHLQVLSIIAFGRKGEIKTRFDEEKLQWEKIHIGKW